MNQKDTDSHSGSKNQKLFKLVKSDTYYNQKANIVPNDKKQQHNQHVKNPS